MRPRPLPAVACAAILSTLLSATLAAKETPTYAYGANVGWIACNPRPDASLVVGDFALSGYLYSGNLGWIHLGDGSPFGNNRYANTSASDCGVNQDGLGNLSGFAYAANAGWINFSWAGANDPNRPRFDLATGAFSGFAYGANIGWISLGSGLLSIARINRPDTDGDGISDDWETEWFGGLSVCGIGTDEDRDGQSDAAEAVADTDPKDPASFLRIVAMERNANGELLVSMEFTSRMGRLYRIDVSEDLAEWTDAGLGTFTPDGDLTVRKVGIPEGDTLYFRVAAILPLSP